MKNRIMLLLSILFIFTGIGQITSAYGVRYGSGKGKKLVTIYTYSGTEAAQSVESKKLLYDDHSEWTDEIKFMVHENGVKVRVREKVFNEEGEYTGRKKQLFEITANKGDVYSFKAGFSDHHTYHDLTLEYKGKKINYNLDYQIRIVGMDEEEGPIDQPEVDLYSGDKGHF